LFAESMQQEGVDMEFLKDKSLNLNGDSKSILDRLYGQEQLEMIIFKLLQDMNYRHNIQEIIKETYDNKLDVNAQFAYLKVVNGDVIPEHIHPNKVRWIAGNDIKTLEDPSVSACSIINHRTFNEIINTYQHKLNTGTGSKGLLDAIDKLMKKDTDFYYYPDKPYFSETYRINTLTSHATDQETYKYDRFGKVDYMKNLFYPYKKTALGRTILEHKMFFKVQKPTRFVVEINGKAPSEKLYKKWRDEVDNRDLLAEFQELGIDEKAPKGSYVVDKFREELWEATQIGHCTLIDVKPYEYTSKKKGTETYVGMPIVAQISRDKSFVLIGENINRRINILSQRIDEIINQAGNSTAMLIDESVISDTDALSVLYNAKKTGIMMFNSTKFAGGNAFSGKHFETIKIGHQLEEMNAMLAMIGILTDTYNSMIGSNAAATGTAQNYDSTQKTQLNINNQSSLKAQNYWENSMFCNQLLQRAADILKKVKAKDAKENVTLSNGERELLQLTKDLSLGDFDIYVEYGSQLKDKKQIIDNAVINALSSGGIDMIEPLIQVLVADDPNQALGIFRKASEVIRVKEQQALQAQQEQAQAMTQIAAQKNQIPITVQDKRNEGMYTLQQMKDAEQRVREDFKGTVGDIKENNDRDKKILDHDLELEKETHRAALNPQPQQPQI